LAVETYPDQLEPEIQDALIWRFMEMWKFRDMMDTEELYFRRADRFDNDKNEGLPPEEYMSMVLGLNPLDLRDRRELNNHLGSDAQFREAFYINCWHLLSDETDKMWKEYGEDGVAICSRYQLLKSALDEMSDRAFLGLVRYGARHLTGINLFRFIYTKRMQYAEEREVRALLWIIDPLATVDRHIGSDDRIHPRPLTPPPADRVSDGHRRRVDLQRLVTEIIVSPWASSATVNEINRLVESKGYAIAVRPSDLTRYRQFLL
jgi:hypothetical protein